MAVLAFVRHCPNMLKIVLSKCPLIENRAITALLTKCHSLRELWLAECELVDDGAFLFLPTNITYKLEVLDLTSCFGLTDRAVEKIFDFAPRVRRLFLGRCRNLTDASAFAMSQLGRNLQDVSLGPGEDITHEAIYDFMEYCYPTIGFRFGISDYTIEYVPARSSMAELYLRATRSDRNSSQRGLGIAVYMGSQLVGTM